MWTMDVARIDQHPVGVRQTFDADLRGAGFLELTRHVISQRRNVPGRTAGRHDHGVSHGRFPAERSHVAEDVLGLVVIELLDDQQRKFEGSGEVGARATSLGLSATGLGLALVVGALLAVAFLAATFLAVCGLRVADRGLSSGF